MRRGDFGTLIVRCPPNCEQQLPLLVIEIFPGWKQVFTNAIPIGTIGIRNEFHGVFLLNPDESSPPVAIRLQPALALHLYPLLAPARAVGGLSAFGYHSLEAQLLH